MKTRVNGLKFTLMSQAETARLALVVRAWRDHGVDPDGGLRARNAIVEGNIGLVGSVQKRWQNEDEDRYQSGFIGLIRAAEEYAPDKGMKFATFAYWCILNACLDHYRKSHFVTCDDKVRRRGDAPVVVFLGDDDVNVTAAPAWASRGDSGELLRFTIRRACLPATQREVIYRVYGLDGAQPCRQHQLAKDYGVCKQAISQRHLAAIASLRRAAADPLVAEAADAHFGRATS